MDIPTGATIYGDRVYNNYDFEDFLADQEEIRLISQIFLNPALAWL